MLFRSLLACNANNGANAGFGCLNTNNRSSNSNANIGFRLYRFKNIEATRTLPHRSYRGSVAGKIIANFNSVSKKLKAL